MCRSTGSNVISSAVLLKTNGLNRLRVGDGNGFGRGQTRTAARGSVAALKTTYQIMGTPNARMGRARPTIVSVFVPHSTLPDAMAKPKKQVSRIAYKIFAG